MPSYPPRPKTPSEVVHLRRIVESGLPDPTGGVAVALLAEQQPLGPRIPGRSVEDGQGRRPVLLEIGEQGDAMGGIRVEVDAGDGARGAQLVALEQEMLPVVVVRVGARQAVEHEIGVLVGLGLRGLDVAAEGRQQVGLVIEIAVVLHESARVLHGHRALGADDLRELGRQHGRHRDANGLRVGVRDTRELVLVVGPSPRATERDRHGHERSDQDSGDSHKHSLRGE